MNSADIYPIFLLALCVWREARGEVIEAKQAVAWSIRNRVNKPRWWGHTFESVILMPWQYSSFNANDPNATKLPVSSDPSWQDSFKVALDIYSQTPCPDNSLGADSYYDRSEDSNPPKWAAEAIHTANVGDLRFFRTVA